MQYFIKKKIFFKKTKFFSLAFNFFLKFFLKKTNLKWKFSVLYIFGLVFKNFFLNIHIFKLLSNKKIIYTIFKCINQQVCLNKNIIINNINLFKLYKYLDIYIYELFKLYSYIMFFNKINKRYKNNSIITKVNNTYYFSFKNVHLIETQNFFLRNKNKISNYIKSYHYYFNMFNKNINYYQHNNLKINNYQHNNLKINNYQHNNLKINFFILLFLSYNFISFIKVKWFYKIYYKDLSSLNFFRKLPILKICIKIILNINIFFIFYKKKFKKLIFKKRQTFFYVNIKKKINFWKIFSKLTKKQKTLIKKKFNMYFKKFNMYFKKFNMYFKFKNFKFKNFKFKIKILFIYFFIINPWSIKIFNSNNSKLNNLFLLKKKYKFQKLNYFCNNIIPSKSFNIFLFKKIKSIFLINKLREDFIPYYYNSLIRFLEHCSGKKFFLQIYPFLNQNINSYFIIRYKIWITRMKSYERRLGHKFFFEEALHIMHISFKLRDSLLLGSWLKTIILRISFWKTRTIFRFLRYLFLIYFNYTFDELKIKGLKIKLKGKISVVGNARKRTILYRIGKTSHSSLNLRISHTNQIINTFTGVMGFQVWIFY